MSSKQHALFTTRMSFSAFRLVSSLASTLLIFYRMRDYNRLQSFNRPDVDLHRLVMQDDLIVILFVWTVGTGAIANFHNFITYVVYLFDRTNGGFLIYCFILDLLLSISFLMLGTIQVVRGGLGLGFGYVGLCLSAFATFLSCSYLDMATIIITKILFRQPGLNSSQPSSPPVTTVIREKQSRSTAILVASDEQLLGTQTLTEDRAQNAAAPAEPTKSEKSHVVSTVKDVLNDSDGI